MPSPQESYTYEELVHYYNTSQTALSNFKEQYPGLAIEKWQSDQDVYGELSSYVSEFGEGLIASQAYLDLDEQEGIEIGTYVNSEATAKRKKILSRIGKEKKLFLQDLESLVSAHEIHLRGMYLELSNLSAKFTADRIQELHRREHWVETQLMYLERYYHRVCSQPHVMKNLELEFFSSLEAVPKKSGIYVLFLEGDIIYIGHSTDINKRLHNHKVVQMSYRNSGIFELECICSFMPKQQALELEKDLIQIFKPEHNVQSKA